MNLPTHLDLSDLVPGERKRVTTYYLGLEYPGEVVAVGAWEPSLGGPLQGDSFFRVVFLQAHAELDPQQLTDARIAVCVPPGGRRPQERDLELQGRVLREIRARYAVAATEPILQDPQRQRYASGNIVTRAGLDLPGPAIFRESSAAGAWVSGIAQALLAWTYPTLPLNTPSLPRPLSIHDVALLFRGVVQGDTVPEVRAVVEAFGPALQLTRAEGHGSAVLQLIRDRLEAAGGLWALSDLYQVVAHVHGLPYPIVSLYALAFLAEGHPPCELQLRPGHGVKTLSGSSYVGQVVLPETVGDLDFPPRLDLEGELLRYSSPASGGTLALYFACLEPALADAREEDAEAATAWLMDAIKALGSDVTHVANSLERLAAHLGEEVHADPRGLLERFRRLGQARSSDAALLTARQLFGSPHALAQDHARYKALRQLVDMEDLIRRATRYLREAYVPPEMQSLGLQRQGLQASLRLGELTRTAFSFAALQDQVARFRREYSLAYANHHLAYHQKAASLLSQLRDAQQSAQALEQLNAISELGEPVGVETLEAFRDLPATLKVCATPSRKLSGDRTPRCRNCGLVLGQQPPSDKVEAVTRELDRGLKEQNRRLSLHVVHKIMRGRNDPRIDRFIKVVQASDVSGLANVLDDQLVTFLREVLSTP
ncbi:MAG: hypothetical protein HY531_03290 [Chloroflexi bacterium]|nr:hypothetical protein [Chloroflexota bacterium]